ncbi:MAG TPA: ATP-dependent DNA helicase RecG [Candidatus Dojkabacteria bacterium]|nr:ATP-dependent DNA helicase RecG [Candidatus Dojkabacteria bacterium]
MKLTADSPITLIKGIGQKQATLYSRLGISTVKDLIFHVPFRYEDTSTLIPISLFKQNGSGTFLAQILDVKTSYFRRPIVSIKVADDTGNLRISFLNQPYLAKTFKKGELYIFDAKITQKGKNRNIYNPKFEKYEDGSETKRLGKITGVYPETAGLKSQSIRAKIMEISNDINDILKNSITVPNLDTLPDAIHLIHFPSNYDDIQKAKKRLSFDEMLRIAVKIEVNRQKRSKQKSKPMKIFSTDVNNFIKSLPYTLTNDQNKSIQEILYDCSKTIPMNRLLNGDVGSGKTVVSAVAILNCIKNGFSAILLAPTTVLAQQHYSTFTKIFEGTGINIELCISTRKNISKADNKLIIGTHAILFEKELPSDLNLVVIDEQHRFGVEQREYFKERKLFSPHYLTMSATPIPRSLTEIFFGGMDVSEIKEKPSGRMEVKTFFTPPHKRIDCLMWVKEKILESKKDGEPQQAFIVYPLIEESDKSSVKSVLNEYENLVKLFDGLNIQYLHGKLKEREKDQLIQDFRDRKIDILLSTTVIEVGIDIPNATIMVIEDAQKFGLAQLHQLRGRVGRGDKESYCFVILGDSVLDASSARDRLKYFSEHASGFEVAEYDLESRGPGEVYGIRQSGVPAFKIADIHDLELLKEAREFAKSILKTHSEEEILNNIFK